jgi:Glucodextranase, domain N
MAVATSSKQTNKVWFTVAHGITGEVCYPRQDIPYIQDLG